VIKPVQTQNVGFAPILRYYFEKYAIAEIIARNGPLDPRKKKLSHRQGCIAMITDILLWMLQLCKLADQTTLLDVILPDKASHTAQVI